MRPHCGEIGQMVEVTVDVRNSGQVGWLGLAAVEHCDLMAPLRQVPDQCQPDKLRAADDHDAHDLLPSPSSKQTLRWRPAGCGARAFLGYLLVYTSLRVTRHMVHHRERPAGAAGGPSR